ncbi:hypothetical protein JTE90_007592 [Oedothorax gibbosus]|uniref:Transposable element P transposase-like RNase H domain-containing protein n=1 Tax=Oedothorax gibbosus TaxID=931172 RepID=A0AAV6TNK8_9ARAC|nr:hypothetical protein JTE90_007592 [Oedothorax gibbosus]
MTILRLNYEWLWKVPTQSIFDDLQLSKQTTRTGFPFAGRFCFLDLMQHPKIIGGSKVKPPQKKKYSPQELESETGCCSNNFSTQAVSSDLQEQLTSANSTISDLEVQLLSANQAFADLKKQIDEELLHTSREIFTLAEENKKLKVQLQQQSTSITNNLLKVFPNRDQIKALQGTEKRHRLDSTEAIRRFEIRSRVLNEVLEFLKVNISSFCENERKCALLLDEMPITPSFEYDSSTCTYLGSSTFPGFACSALVIRIRGISSKWK